MDIMNKSNELMDYSFCMDSDTSHFTTMSSNNTSSLASAALHNREHRSPNPLNKAHSTPAVVSSPTTKSFLNNTKIFRMNSKKSQNFDSLAETNEFELKADYQQEAGSDISNYGNLIELDSVKHKLSSIWNNVKYGKKKSSI
jgi:hypothetical protein